MKISVIGDVKYIKSALIGTFLKLVYLAAGWFCDGYTLKTCDKAGIRVADFVFFGYLFLHFSNHCLEKLLLVLVYDEWVFCQKLFAHSSYTKIYLVI